MSLPLLNHKKVSNPAPTSSPKAGFFRFNASTFRVRRKATLRQQHLLLVLLILLPLLVHQVYSAFVEYKTQRQAVLERQIETARSVNRTVTTFLNDQISNNAALTFSFVNYKGLSQAQGNTILAKFRQQRPFLLAYRFVDSNGLTLFSDPPELIKQDLSQDTSFQALQNGQDNIISNLYPSQVDNKTPVFSVASAVHADSGQFLGVLLASINTTKLDQVFDIKLGQRGRGSFSIHDRSGVSIYNSLNPNEPYESRVARAKQVVPTVKAALEGREMVSDTILSAIDGLEKMGASTPIILAGWSASVAEPVDDAMAVTVGLIIPRLVLFMIIVLLALAAAWLYSNYLTRPLLALQKAATSFGQGNLDARASIKARTAEIEQLAFSFNQMAEQVAEETRSKDAFLSQAAHELKTPLTVIKSSSQLLIVRQEKELTSVTEDSPTAKRRLTHLKLLQNIEHQTNRMAGLINRLLELSRFQIGRYEFEIEPVNLARLVEKCVEAARLLTTPERHPITLNIAEAPAKQDWIIEGDAERLEQVVLNLLENAIKYSPAGGPVNVHLGQCTSQVETTRPLLELTVTDQGLGLKPEEIERLFERYYRAHGDDHTITGLGLGLFISAEIVRQHGGQLWATSPGPNLGSTFHLVLPQS